jgi:hypothetical protein
MNYCAKFTHVVVCKVHYACYLDLIIKIKKLTTFCFNENSSFWAFFFQKNMDTYFAY